MADTSLAVRIATIMDASGLKKADKGISGLEASAKRLGKTLGIALSVGAVTAFGKSSVNAFMEDQKAAALLANTVKNLGKEMELPSIEKFISDMEKAAGIADDELRPAMQSLLTTFKNTADAQSMLALATEVSRGSGKDLATVVADLTKAASGQTKGLEKYKLGVSAAELKTMSFAEIMERLNKQFKGSNAAYLKTYAGQMEVLKVTAGNVQEVIGKGLVDALMAVTGAIDVQDLSNKLIGFAQNLADAFVKVGNLIAENWAWVKNLGVAIIAVFTATKVYAGVAAFLALLGKIAKAMKYIRTVSIGAAIAEMAAINPLAALAGGTALVGSIIGATKLIDKLTEKAEGFTFKTPTFEGLDDPKFAKSEAEKIKQQKLNTAELKKQNAIKKATAIFDLKQAGIIAALKGNISDEDRKRLELQLAIEQDNVKEAQKLTYQLALAQGLGVKIAEDLASLPEASNPFAAWGGYLDSIELQAKRIAAFGSSELTPTGNGVDFGGNKIGTPVVGGFTPPPAGTYGSGGGVAPIVVQIDGKTIASALMDQSLSGNQAYVNRRTGGFE